MDFINGKSIPDLWAERTELSGNKRFLVYEDNEGTVAKYTFTEFNELVDRTARAFHDELGIEKGDKVTIHLPNSPEYLQVWFALMKIGAVSVHSNVNHAAREVNYTVDNSDSIFVVTSPTYEDTITEAVEGTSIEDILYARVNDESRYDSTLSDIVNGHQAELPSVTVSADDTAQIIFTSGTTSDPKGVIHTHANLIYSGERRSHLVALRPEDAILTSLPVFHVNAQSSVLMSLTVGNPITLVEEFKASKYIDQLCRHGATITNLIGTQVRALLAQPESPDDDAHDLRVVSFAINVTDKERERFESRFDAPLLNGYGLSEAMTVVTKAPVHGKRKWPSIGRPAFDRDVYLIDEKGDQVPTGEMGEIAVDGIRGRNLMVEYYQMPERTDEAFTDEGWLLTGDYGRFDDEGYLYFVDRKKNIIETRGENVSESEVEEVLESHDGVEEVGVVGVEHEFYGEVVKAYVKRLDPEITESDLEEYAVEQLASFKVPEEIEFVDDFPRTSIGKIKKSTLRAEEKGDSK